MSFNSLLPVALLFERHVFLPPNQHHHLSWHQRCPVSMIPCPSCHWCQAPSSITWWWRISVFHLYAGLPPAGHLGVSGGWGPPDWPGGWILSVLEGNHLRERAGLRWHVHSSVPLQVQGSVHAAEGKCWWDIYRLNSFNRREQEVIWRVQVLHSVCRSQLFKKPTIFYGIRVLTINFTTVGRLLLTPELLYAA